MGKRGPPKKPTALKLLQGVPGGEHKLNKNELRAESTKGAKPSFELDSAALEIWKEVVKRLEAVNVLTDLDRDVLTRYCDLRARWMEARSLLLKHGAYIDIFAERTQEELDHGVEPKLKYTQKTPYFSIYESLHKELTRLEQMFGMSPSARAALEIKTPAKKSQVKADLYG